NLTTVLKLDYWNSFISNAVRNILHRDYIDASDFIDERLLAITWPKSNLELENSIIKMMEAYSNYIHHYLKYAIVNELNNEYFKEDTSFKRIYPNPDYDELIKRNNLWIK